MKKLISICAALILSAFCFGQETDRFSVSFGPGPLPSLVDQLEKETPFRFYFIPAWVDTVEVSLKKDDAPITTMLEDALAGTGINFFIQGRIIILTPGLALTDHVDSTFFAPPRSAEEIASTRSTVERTAETTRLSENAVIDIGRKGNSSKTSFTLTGYVRERKSGEAIPGALVYTKSGNYWASTDQFGFYSITLPSGLQTISVQLVGMNTLTKPINVLGDGKLDFTMDESVTQLREVIIESDVDVNISNVQMGTARIDLRSMKNIPKILGENDPLKVATSLPGVRSVGEGASGINVRGGHADQNLVILNEATIYNPSHFLGFFSVFNPDAIRSFELFKSGIPVQHGGRLSSTFELLMRDGNQKKISGQGGIGPITSHLTLEFPLVKDKTSIMVGGRSTYSNWVLNRLPETVIKNTSAMFYDFFARVAHSPNDKNTFYLSFYNSYDEFSLSSDTLFSYSNRLISFQWRHLFNPNLDAVLSVTRSDYDYNIGYSTLPAEAFDMGFSINDSNVKWELSHSRGRHKITAGIQGRLYGLNPGMLRQGHATSLIEPRHVNREKGMESALFLADNVELTLRLSLYAGIRYSHFATLGPAEILTYAPGMPKESDTVTDTLQYGSNDMVAGFHGPEYRTSMRYKLTDASSIKASYNRTRQYVHMLSNTVSVSPTDTWKLSDPHVKPQVADQVSVGYYKNIRNDVYEFSAEVYYKWIQNILDYKTGATLLVNNRIDQQILQGNGKAYGAEFLIRKKSGKVTGWLGYSHSRTLIQLDSEIKTERINQGRYFPANYDKPHDVNLITNYKITRRYSLSFNFAYSTGRPITYPVAVYRFGNAFRVNYSDRNAYRIPDYVRADIGFNIEGNHRIKKLAHSYWSISVYNVLGRKNPYSVYFRVDGEDIKAYKLSIFGAPIPTITYHFKF